MPHPMLNILAELNEITKSNQTGLIACHWCNNQNNIIKHAPTSDMFFSGDERINEVAGSQIEKSL